jgi:hypothetical protein
MTFDDDDEKPTRPDLPRFIAATRCVHCGLVFGEHAVMFPKDFESKCQGLRRNFAPEEIQHDPER